MNYIDDINRLLDMSGQISGSENVEIRPIIYGGNNQIFIINGKYIAKKYFRSSDDDRDRFLHETLFVNYAINVAPQFVPRLLAKDPDAGWALFERINGNTFRGKDVNQKMIAQAAEFFVKLNNNDICLEHKRFLPNASDACFSLEEHLISVKRRIDSLKKFSSSNEKLNIILDSLQQKFDYYENDIINSVINKNLLQKLSIDEICISPSDFGFHNALIMDDGKIVFIDFEYAGIDDPAKMIADFFSQVSIRVDATFFNSFFNDIVSCFKNSQGILDRVNLLLPLYKIKWIAIVLNAFDPINMARRKFANPNLNELIYQRDRLSLAESLLYNIK